MTLRRYSVVLATALALAGCGSDDSPSDGNEVSRTLLQSQAAYACMPESDQRRYDALGRRLRASVRRVARDEDASTDDIHADPLVKALEDAMESMIDKYRPRVGRRCGSPLS